MFIRIFRVDLLDFRTLHVWGRAGLNSPCRVRVVHMWRVGIARCQFGLGAGNRGLGSNTRQGDQRAGRRPGLAETERLRREPGGGPPSAPLGRRRGAQILR